MKKGLTIFLLTVALYSCNNGFEAELLYGDWYLNYIELNNKKSRGGQIMVCPTLEINEDHSFESIAHVIFRNGKWSKKDDSITFKYPYGANDEIVEDRFRVRELTQDKLTLQKDSIALHYARHCIEESN